MEKYPDFWSVVLGNGPHGFFFGFLTMGLIAAFTMFCILAVGRDKNSQTTPEQWSWKFYWMNNVLRILATFFLLFLFVRVAYEYVAVGWMLFWSIGIGFGFPKLAHIAKDWGVLTTNNLSEKIKKAIDQQKDLDIKK
jgi:hypothetical protein